MELESHDLTEEESEESEEWTLVYYDRDNDCLGFAHYDSEEDLLGDCETEDEEPLLGDYLVFRGKLDPLRIQRTLSLLDTSEYDEEEEEEEEDEERPTTEDVERNLRQKVSPPLPDSSFEF